MNNLYQKKIELAKEILETEYNDLQTSKNILNNLENEYFGKALETKTAIWVRDVKSGEVKIEALEHLIWEFENFLKLDADVSLQEGVETTESKIQAEELNQ